MSSSASPPFLVWGLSTTMQLSYSIASHQGRRPALTDSVVAVPSFTRLSPPLGLGYFAVFDGYRGSTVSEHLRERLGTAIAEQIEHEVVTDNKTALFLRTNDVVEWWRKTMQRAFWKVESELVCPNGAGVGDGIAWDAGATALVALVLDNYTVLANCGFSKAVMARGGEAVVLTPEHEDDMAELQQWAEATGACMTHAKLEKAARTGRVFGSAKFKAEVEMAAPEVMCVKREPGDEFLILASNGVWGSVTPAAACAFVRQRLFTRPPLELEARAASPTVAAGALAQHAIDKGSPDNVTVLLILLAPGTFGVRAS